MIHKLLLFTFLLVWMTSGAWAQLKGTTEAVFREVPTDTSAASILYRYVSEGYFDARIDSVEGKGLGIIKGCRYTVKELIFEPEDWDSEPVYKSQKGVYKRPKVEAEIEAMVNQYISDGYLQAEAGIDHFQLNRKACEVSIYVSLKRGKRFFSSGIFFSGLSNYSPKYLSRISGYRDSLLLSESNLRKLRAELTGSELFKEVSKPVILTQEGKKVILFAVQERQLNQFDGMLGYSPDAAGNVQIVGDIRASFSNIVGEGDGLNFQYQRLRPETSRMKVGISQNWIGEIPVGVEAGFGIYQNDSTYQTRTFTINAYYWLGPGFKLTGSINSVISTSAVTEESINREPDGRKQSASLGFNYSQLDRYELPRSGYRLAVSLALANKDLDEDSLLSYRQQEMRGTASVYVPVSALSTVAIGIHGYYNLSKRYTESDLVRFGGANSFRGYAEEQFLASELLWADTEYRYFIKPSSYMFVFGALGRYYRPPLINEVDDSFSRTELLYASGLGFSYKTRIGQLKFTYALSPGESLGNGKVHIGFLTSL